jgi:aminopeptidase YwaD
MDFKKFHFNPGYHCQMKLCLLISLLISKLIISTASAQDVNYARSLINTLTSKDFAGRGYVNDGCGKAARFIREQFDSLGLEPLAGSYAQNFTFPVNTFPGKMEVAVDGKKLVPGDDYIVYPFSSGADHKYRLKRIASYLSPEIFNENNGVCYAVLADSLTESERSNLFADLASGTIRSGALILLQQKKLTWSVAKSQYKIPVVSVLQYYVPDSVTEVELSITSRLNKSYKAQNILAYVKGSAKPDSFIVFSAHYDHLGMMGSEIYFPGANDNASGVSMLLDMARYFSKKENQPECSIAFIAFAGEEAGLAGSKYYTEHPLFPMEKIKFLVNLDLLGTGDDGMMVVNATEYRTHFQLLDSINTAYNFLPKLGQRGKAKNSDHYYFTEKGVPSFFFYTMGGIQAYHDVNDKAETLPLTEYEDVFRLIVKFTGIL